MGFLFKKYNMSVLGTELKLKVNVSPIDDKPLSQCDFYCTFFTNSSKKLELHKSKMHKVDDDTYIALIDSKDLGLGTIKMTIKVLVPDSDFINGYRTEIETISTGITITKE
jgi:hypothetical protein